MIERPPGPPPRTPEELMALQDSGMVDVKHIFEAYGDIFYSSDLGTQLYGLRHPDHIHELLGKKASAFHKRTEDIGPFLGKGLLTADGALWQQQRRRIQPSFSPERISLYSGAIQRQAELVLSRWTPGQVVDVSRDMMRATLGVVCDALFDHDIADVSDAVEDAMTVFQTSTDWQVKRESLKRVDNIIYEMIDTRISDPDPSRIDLLTRLIDATDEDGAMSRRQLRDELITFMLAGHETSSQALTWAWYLLGQHPKVEARFHEAIDQGDDVYIERVAKEAMRLYPPSYALPRVAVEDTTIADYAIPVGAQVIAFIYHCHRDPRWFPEPESFDPDRFDDARNTHPRAFMPFGAGGRACIGKALAMLELVGILKIIGGRVQLRLHPEQEVDLDPSITLRPKYGMRMIVESR